MDTRKFYQTAKEKTYLILYNFFAGLATKRMHSNSFYEASIHKAKGQQRQRHHKEREYRPISVMNMDTKVLSKH